MIADLNMPNQNAEQIARDKIDSLLESAGWQVQDVKSLNLAKADGIAVREFPMAPGFGVADYLLYYKRAVIGVVEAKQEGTTLTGVEVQTEKYSQGLPKNVPAHQRPIPFLYESTGAETRFTNALDPIPASRDVFTFHRPEHLGELLNLSNPSSGQIAEIVAGYVSGTLLQRLQSLPPLMTSGMRECQIEAITNLEKSLAGNKRRALIQMQTGSGKTFTAVAQAYRLIKHGGAKRVLFIVDRGNLARQTLHEFQQYETPDDHRKFTELYNVQHLQSNKIDDAAKVVITTIQRLYSILKGEEEFDPEAEEESTTSAFAKFQKDPIPVVYNPKIPIETFDVVFTDECHRSIYNLWRQVLEYFDAYLIGLTATPSKQTLGFFNQNLVMEYGHAQAVADKVNVDFTVYRINTKVTSQGATVEAGIQVDKRHRKTRKVRWEELDDDFTYNPNQLDRDVVSIDQIRTVIRTFKDKFLPEVFPEREWVPKTLIFAKDDSHAEDIVRIIREEFAKGNDFCEKITYKSSTARIVDPVTQAITYKNTGIKPEDLLSSFRNSPYPRIAVTVDMIATGTDIKPLEIVFFMRDVTSANYFEQMKGRGCRVMTPTEFRAVTPDAINKSRYIIIDAVGVTEHERKDSSPCLEKQPTVSFKNVLQAVAAGSTETELVSTLASRLSRLNNIIGEGQRKQIEEVAGETITTLTKNLVASIDPDKIEALLHEAQLSNPNITADQLELKLKQEALEPFYNSTLRELILAAQQDAEQTIDTITKDEVTEAGISLVATEKARSTITSFREFIEANKDELTALQVLYSRRKGHSPTFTQLKELASAISTPPHYLTPSKLWEAYATLDKSRVKGKSAEMVTDLVSLVRFALEQETILQPFSETVEDRFQRWLTEQNAAERFTSEQMTWLHMIKEHIKGSASIDREDLELDPFIQAGGLGKAFQLFGEDLSKVMQELTEALAA